MVSWWQTQPDQNFLNQFFHFSSLLLPPLLLSCAFIAATFAENHLVPYFARPEPGPGTEMGLGLGLCKRDFLSF